jgi:hypothetical protein
MVVMLGVHETKIYVFWSKFMCLVPFWNTRNLKPKYVWISEQFYGWPCTLQQLTSSADTKLTDHKKIIRKYSWEQNFETLKVCCFLLIKTLTKFPTSNKIAWHLKTKFCPQWSKEHTFSSDFSSFFLLRLWLHRMLCSVMCRTAGW